MEKTSISIRPTCNDCRFSDEVVQDLERKLICRRRPPVLAFAPVQQSGRVGFASAPFWPTVGANEWCGELERTPI